MLRALTALLLMLPAAVHAAGNVVLDKALEGAAAGVPVRATVVLADEKADGTLAFQAVDYKGEGDAVDFWPASTIKLYAALAALELVHGMGLSLEVKVVFERRTKEGAWVTDCARTLREMLSEVFVRSSNEDYTLLLRMTGLDAINQDFLTPARGFQRSALMRGYVTRRPYVYLPEEPQRITLQAPDGTVKTREHTWSGRSWSGERGATVIDAKTGNCTTTRDMADCLRRVMFHERISEAERFRISQEMADFLRFGGNGLTGLETKHEDSGPYAWKNSGETVYPEARYFHKAGLISTYVLDLACLDDRKASGRAVIIAASAGTGKEDIMSVICRAALEWAKVQPKP